MITVDLHTHILPWMDDGASDADISMQILRKEAGDGVSQIVLTPHYNPIDTSISEFRVRRTVSFQQLKKALDNSDLKNSFDLRTAAEIRYNPSLVDMEELDDLCVTGTKVLLIEFSFHHYPEFVRNVFYRLQSKGYTVLMAHVERYPWLREKTDFLYDLVCDGAYAQFNADSIVKDRDALSFIKKMIDCGLVHCIGTDTHNMDERPPLMKDAEEVLLKKTNLETVSYLNENAQMLLGGGIPNTFMPSKPKKGFWDFLRK